MSKNSRKKVKDTITLDRVLGMFIGHALAEALGGPHELHGSKKAIYTGKLEHRNNFRGRYQKEEDRIWYSIAQNGDDVQKTLNIARSMNEYGYYNRDDVLKKHLEWAAHPNIRGMGEHTKSLFAPSKKGISIQPRTYEKRMDKIRERCIKEGREILSNGSLMSCIPLALLPDDERDEAILDDVLLTNPFEVSLDVNRVYIESLRTALKGGTVKEVVLAREAQNKDVTNVLIKATEDDIIDVTINKGFVLNAFWCAYYSLIHFTSYKEAIDFIIRLGGDTDTNACITGGLLGAYLGFNRLYEEERDNIDILLACTTEDSDLPVPSQWRTTDLLELVENLHEKFCRYIKV